MIIRIVFIFLLVMVALALLAGPGVRRALLKILGIDRGRR